MMRFVVIATLRGAVEPAELLADGDQQAAIARYEADEWGMGETVVWRGAQPQVKPRGWDVPGVRYSPSVSAELKKTLRGAPMELDRKWARHRDRAGLLRRMG